MKLWFYEGKIVMVFWITLGISVFFALLYWLGKAHGCLPVLSWVVVGIMATVLMFNYIGINADVAAYNKHYDSLVYQLKNGVYENDNDIGKRDLYAEIQEWNYDLAYRKEIQNDFWVGIFYPNVYDNFEFIELK